MSEEHFLLEALMPALTAGIQAPDISLPLSSGGSFSLRDALKRGPVLAAFFKVSCPVCQMAFPFIQRMFAAYGSSPKVTIAGISQDSLSDTQAFERRFGVSFPVALDDTKKYPVSKAYGLTNVPSLFWITQDGIIEMSSVGWSKAEFDELNGKLAAAAGVARQPLFTPGENVPDFKPG